MTFLPQEILPYAKKRLTVFERLAPSSYIIYLAGIIVYIAQKTSIDERWQAIKPYINEGRKIYGQDMFDEEVKRVSFEYKKNGKQLRLYINEIARESYRL